MNGLQELRNLVKALEAGNYNAAPSTLVQGAALQTEDLSPIMNLETFDDQHIKLQKMLKVDAVKSDLAQFDRQLSYGIFGGTAQTEGNVGQEETSDFVRVVIPMSFYSHSRRNTIAANMVGTVDGVKADERSAADAAKKIAGDIEFDGFRGKADFSNGGLFDGNPLAIAGLPNMLGLDPQIRMSDTQANARDLMFSEYGSDESVVIPCGAPLTQDNVEDASVRSALNFGSADKLVVDPRVLSSYNKIAFGKERIILAGSPMDATGADLRKQWVSGGSVSVEASRFLSGKAKPARARAASPAAPSIATAVANTSTTVAGVTTTFGAGQVYVYYVTQANEFGESVASNSYSVTVAANGDEIQIVITASGACKYFNVYRTLSGAPAATAKFVGRLIRGTAGTDTFFDLNNRQPGAVTGFLIQGDTMAFKELAPYSRLKLAVTDLSQPEAFFRFTSLAVMSPRKNCILDNLTGY